ncbi:MAG: hypothetical protein AAF840_11200, partial [Bacteroidota bacterium]
MFRSLLLLLFLSFSLLTCLHAQRGSDLAAATAAFDDGVQHLLDGSPKKARRSFSTSVKLDTSFIAARRFLGLSEELLGNFSAAADAYQRVLARDTS